MTNEQREKCIELLAIKEYDNTGPASKTYYAIKKYYNSLSEADLMALILGKKEENE